MWPFHRKGASGFSFSSTAEEVTQGIDGTGLTAIVTGASSGIGCETARVLALRGVHVVMAVRNVSSGNTVKQDILKNIPFAKIDVIELDLSSMASIRKFALEFNAMNFPLNILINNAGIMGTPFSLSEDGLELQFATNHIGHFLLTNLLLEKMKSTSQSSNIEGRIVNVSSVSHKYAIQERICFDNINQANWYGVYYGYVQSKLANILHANELSRRLKKDEANITANSLHPGVIRTNIFRFGNALLNVVTGAIMDLGTKNVEQGAATTCYVALNPQVKGVTGKYFKDCNLCMPSWKALDEELAKKLWDFSMNVTQS